MMAQDERPSRLERMKEEVRRLRAASPGDRMGVLVFAGRSYVLSPLTIDEGALDLFLDNLDPSVVGQAGSSMARTIRQGVDLLTLTNSGADRALVVMSDGEAFEPIEDVQTEAKRAGEQGISVVTVGFGTTTGATIPIKQPDGSNDAEEGREWEHGRDAVPSGNAAGRGRRRARHVHSRGRHRQGVAREGRAVDAPHTVAGQPGRREQDAALSVVPVSGVPAAAARHLRCSSDAGGAGPAPPPRTPLPRPRLSS